MMDIDTAAADGIVYRTAYAISYAIVFPVALLVHWVPRQNSLVLGLIDGGKAALAATHRPAAEEV